MNRPQGNMQRKRHPLGLLHRHGGIVAAILVIVICATGIALNHTDDLRLAERHSDNTLLLKLYGIDNPILTSFQAGEQFVTSDGEHLYINGEPVTRSESPIDAVLSTAAGLRIDSGGDVWLFTIDGQLLEVSRVEMMTGSPADKPAIPTTLPTPLAERVYKHYRGNGIDLEQVILDLHSGRLAGRAGVFLADAAALLFILLASSGVWLWFKTRRR